MTERWLARSTPARTARPAAQRLLQRALGQAIGEIEQRSRRAAVPCARRGIVGGDEQEMQQVVSEIFVA